MDSNAISVGYAIQSGVVLQKCSNHWCRIGTTQVVNSSLVNSISSNVVSLVETYQYHNCISLITQAKGTNKNSNLCAVADNGLIYDNCEGGNGDFYDASSYCSSKGMRIPKNTEAKAWDTNGVPSCSGLTWTSLSHTGSTSSYWLWVGSTTSYGPHYYGGGVRCVR